MDTPFHNGPLLARYSLQLPTCRSGSPLYMKPPNGMDFLGFKWVPTNE